MLARQRLFSTGHATGEPSEGLARDEKTIPGQTLDRTARAPCRMPRRENYRGRRIPDTDIMLMDDLTTPTP